MVLARLICRRDADFHYQGITTSSSEKRSHCIVPLPYLGVSSRTLGGNLEAGTAGVLPELGGKAGVCLECHFGSETLDWCTE